MYSSSQISLQLGVVTDPVLINEKYMWMLLYSILGKVFEIDKTQVESILTIDNSPLSSSSSPFPALNMAMMPRGGSGHLQS